MVSRRCQGWRILEYVFEGDYMRLLGEKDFSEIANIVLRYWRRHPERNAGSGVARLRKKVIRVACNQGVETSHATLVRLPFKGGPQDSRRQPQKTNSGLLLKIPHNLLIFSVSIDTVFTVIGGKPNECLPRRENREHRPACVTDG